MKLRMPNLKRGLVTAMKAVGLLSAVPTRGVRGGARWHDLFGAGTWQKDIEPDPDHVLAFSTVYACVTLIASDIAKIGLELMQEDEATGIHRKAKSPAFSPVLKKPNPYQTLQQFVECWVISKLRTGNAYILKVRDARQVVVAMYVLDPNLVTPLVAPNGAVFYQCERDDLSRLPYAIPAIPSSEIIHDRMECLFHPLVGISPVFACGLAAHQGLKILGNSARFFENMSRPSGILTAPDQIEDETAERLKREWETNYGADKVGKVAVLGDGLKYEALGMSPKDALLTEQLNLSAAQVCTAFHVPGFMVGVGALPSFDNVEALWQQYYAQCLQKLIEAIESLLDEGLGLEAAGYCVEFDLDDLLRMDSKSLAEVEGQKVKNGIAAPNEARRKFNLAPKAGGDAVYLQQQNYSIEALAKRDAGADPFATAPAPAPAAPAEPAEPTPPAATQEDVARSIAEALAPLAGLIEKQAAGSTEALTKALDAMNARLDAVAAEQLEQKRKQADAERSRKFIEALNERIRSASAEA